MRSKLLPIILIVCNAAHASALRVKRASDRAVAWSSAPAHPRFIEHLLCTCRCDASKFEWVQKWRHPAIEV